MLHGWKENLMLVKRLAARTHLFDLIWFDIFNRFPVIQSLKVRHLSIFFAFFCLPWVRPWDYRGKCHNKWIERKFNALSNALQHVPIYLQPFPSNSSRKFKSSPS